MQRYPLLVIAVATGLSLLPAQQNPQDETRMVFSRIERALRESNPASIDDLLESGMMIRLGDSLYKGVSSIRAMELLNEYFEEKDSIEVVLTSLGSGKIVYSTEGRRDTTAVDVRVHRSRTGMAISAMNISNYPLATMFMDRRPARP